MIIKNSNSSMPILLETYQISDLCYGFPNLPGIRYIFGHILANFGRFLEKYFDISLIFVVYLAEL